MLPTSTRGDNTRPCTPKLSSEDQFTRLAVYHAMKSIPGFEMKAQALYDLWPEMKLAEIAARLQAKGYTQGEQIGRAIVAVKVIGDAVRQRAVELGEPAEIVTQEIQIPKETQEKQREPSRPRSRTGVGSAVAEEEEEPQSADAPRRSARKERAAWFKQHAECSLADFMLRAWNYNYQESADDPEWHTPMFHFAWLLRGHREMQNMTGKQAADAVEAQCRIWTGNARRNGTKPIYVPFGTDHWENWFGLSRVEARNDFCDCWDKVRFRPGQNPLDQAVAAARRMRLLLSDDVRAKRPVEDSKARNESDYEFFVSVAGHLQVIVGDRPIMLPCREVAAMLNVSPMSVSRYHRWAVEDGILKIVKAHAYGKGKRDAREFRFDVSRWSHLRERAQKGSQASFEWAEAKAGW